MVLSGATLVKIIIYRLVLWALFAFPAVVQAANHAVILQYHHFSTDTPPSTSVTPERFEGHLDYLEKNGFSVWPLEQVINYIREKRPLPDRTVAITVDDAFIDIYTEGWPRVKRRGWPMTVFVNTDAVDQKRRGALTWEQMREMQAGGVQFANHTSTHGHLVRRLTGESESDWRQRVIADIEHAQNRLTEELGAIPRYFVYPYGEYDQTLLDIIDELGYTGFGQQSGPVGPLSDIRVLPRFPMGGNYTEMEGFRVKVNALPLPVISVDPVDPLLPLETDRPELRITLGKAAYNPEQITCYVTGQGMGAIHLDSELLTVRANKPLPVGRSRYNCTVRHLKENRYYWFSHPWIRRKPDGSWYRE